MGLRANRRGWPGSGPPSQAPGVLSPSGEGRESALETNGETEKGGQGLMSANTATSRDTPATQKHTPTHTAAQRAGRRGQGREGGAHLVLCGAGGGGQGECIEHVMLYTLKAWQERVSPHGHMGWTRTVLRERWGQGVWGKGSTKPWPGLGPPTGHPWAWWL